MAMTRVRIGRLDGGLLVLGAGPLAAAFFDIPKAQRFEDIAGTRPRYAITGDDIELINSVMGARSPRHLWEPLLEGRRRWLRRLEPTLDLITTSDQEWRSIGGDELVEKALVGCVGPGRSIGIATKLLHLKRPRLFPILDRLVVELVGGRVPVEAQAANRGQEAADLVLHLRKEGRANLEPLRATQAMLRRRSQLVAVPRVCHHRAEDDFASPGLSRVSRCSAIC